MASKLSNNLKLCFSKDVEIRFEYDPFNFINFKLIVRNHVEVR